MDTNEDPRIQYVRSKIKSYPDFPKKGIDFKDLFSAMRDTTALIHLIELSKEKAKAMKGLVDCVVGLDSRGFLFGPIMAAELGVAFVPVSITFFGMRKNLTLGFCIYFFSNYRKKSRVFRLVIIFGRLERRENCLENVTVLSML